MFSSKWGNKNAFKLGIFWNVHSNIALIQFVYACSRLFFIFDTHWNFFKYCGWFYECRCRVVKNRNPRKCVMRISLLTIMPKCGFVREKKIADTLNCTLQTQDCLLLIWIHFGCFWNWCSLLTRGLTRRKIESVFRLFTKFITQKMDSSQNSI